MTDRININQQVARRETQSSFQKPIDSFPEVLDSREADSSDSDKARVSSLVAQTKEFLKASGSRGNSSVSYDFSHFSDAENSQNSLDFFA